MKVLQRILPVGAALSVALGLCLSTKVAADMPSFDVVRAQLARQKVDDVIDSYDGFGLEASKQLAQNFFVGGQYQEFELADTVDSQQFGVYVGLYGDVARMFNTRVATLFGYRKATLDSALFNESDDTGFIGVSVRNRAFDRVELRADLHYLDWNKSESGFMGALGFSYFIGRGVAFEVGYKKQGNTQTFSSGIGYFF